MFSAPYLYFKKHKSYSVSFTDTHNRVAVPPPPITFDIIFNSYKLSYERHAAVFALSP